MVAYEPVWAIGTGEVGHPGGRADLLRVGGGGHLAGADRPHRLVGHDDAAGLLGRARRPAPRPADASDVLDVLAGLAHLLALADAEDRA